VYIVSYTIINIIIVITNYFVGWYGFALNLLAKLLAISKSLELATTMSLIQNGVQSLTMIRHICGVKECWSFSFNHTLCEGNKCAKWMVKFNTSSDSPQNFGRPTLPTPYLDWSYSFIASLFDLLKTQLFPPILLFHSSNTPSSDNFTSTKDATTSS
jgi:hypothetical protein